MSIEEALNHPLFAKIRDVKKEVVRLLFFDFIFE